MLMSIHRLRGQLSENKTVRRTNRFRAAEKLNVRFSLNALEYKRLIVSVSCAPNPSFRTFKMKWIPFFVKL